MAVKGLARKTAKFSNPASRRKIRWRKVAIECLGSRGMNITYFMLVIVLIGFGGEGSMHDASCTLRPNQADAAPSPRTFHTTVPHLYFYLT